MDEPLITITRMNEEDTVQVASLETMNFSEPWPEKEFVNAVHDDKYIYLVAKEGMELAGYAGCFVAGDSSDITNIAVNEKYRRLGIGAKLLELLSEEAAKKGACSIFLEVRESNTPAINLYTKLNFEQVGMRRNFYRKPTENAILMEKKL